MPKSEHQQPRVIIINLGCPKNQVDGEMMAALLEQNGYTLTDDPGAATFAVVNTCGFLEAARAESISELQQLAKTKRAKQKLIAAGCLAQLAPDMLFRAVPNLDAAISTRRWQELPALFQALSAGESKLTWQGDSPLPTPYLSRNPSGATAYVKIAEGCSGPCAFCVIPKIKGRLRSRPRQEIVQEVDDLAQRGYQEVVLVAQDTTAYGKDLGETDGLPALLEAITAAASSLPWLRLMYTYPQHISDRLIAVMQERPQICHYLDIPLQHAHPDVLKRMHRPNDIEAVSKLLDKLRLAMPDVALRTTFIVGFPGESDVEYRTLLDFVQQIKFEHAGVFAYSREPGTPAYNLPNQCPEEIKEQRRHELLLTQQSISLVANQSQMGRELKVLVEGAGDGMSVGRTYRDAPEVDGLALLPGEFKSGSFILGKVQQAMEYDLLLQPLNGEPDIRRQSRRHRPS